MDDIARYNQERWRALVAANALFTRPVWDLDAAAAREMVDPEGRMGDLAGQRVLCLAGSGGKQAPAFALLGAQVTVFDLMEEQLASDRAVAAHYGVTLTTIQGDMRDLSALDPASFDLVWHPYSLNFVPDAGVVFAGVARALRPGGRYVLMCANPFAVGVAPETWDGAGYPLAAPYLDGPVAPIPDPAWVYDAAAAPAPVPPPREYRHTLSTLINGLVANGFVLRHLEEVREPDGSTAAPGTWDHLSTVLPAWFWIWTIYRPDLPSS